MTKSEAKPGHNSGLDPAQERAFVVNYPRLVAAEAEMAASKGEMAGIYKALEAAGFTKDDIKWWNKTKKLNVGESLETMRRRIGLARLMGHGLGRQMDIFDKDRTPIEDAAFVEGRARGLLRGDAGNPYDIGSIAGQNWQRGFNEGNSEINKMLAENLNDIIKSGGDEGEGDDAATGSDPDADWDAAAPTKEAAE